MENSESLCRGVSAATAAKSAWRQRQRSAWRDCSLTKNQQKADRYQCARIPVALLEIAFVSNLNGGTRCELLLLNETSRGLMNEGELLQDEPQSQP